MHTAFIDTIRGFTRTEKDAPKSARCFRSKVWLDYAQHLSGLPWRDFTDRYIYRNRARSGLADKWRSEKCQPTLLSAQQLERHLPGTLPVFRSPLFTLLENRPFTAKELSQLFASYREPRDSLIVWRFPNDEELRARRHWVPTLHEKDTSSLVNRGDIWGFITSLWSTRMSEAEGEPDYHFLASMDVYRAIPAALKEPWLAPHADQLFSLLENVRSRVLSTYMLFDVDLDIIKRQAADPEHEPLREYLPRDPITHRFIDLEDPILPARLISGRVWRDQQRRCEERRAARQQSQRASSSMPHVWHA
ncbi:MAG: hypothetical protein ACYCUI_09235 [Vulcanimicrobiaceae bacterium]